MSCTYVFVLTVAPKSALQSLLTLRIAMYSPEIAIPDTAQIIAFEREREEKIKVL